jgi:hypothetical protein
MPSNVNGSANKDEGNVVLRSYQQEILKIITKASVTRSRVFIALSPGLGRTTTIAFALNELFRKGEIRKALILVPNLVLREQYFYALDQTRPYARISKLEGKAKQEMFHDTQLPTVVVSTLASFRMIEHFRVVFDIIFLDEFRNLSEKDWAAISTAKTSIIGFSAMHPLEISPKLLSLFGKKVPDYSYGMSPIRLGELAEVRAGAAYGKKELQEEGSWKFIRPRDIEQSGELDVHTFISKDAASRKAKSALKVGDILLQNIFGFEKIALVRKKDLPAIASQNLFIIRPKKISPKLLFEYLQSEAIADAFRKQLSGRAHGQIIRHVSVRDVGEIPVPLPFSRDQLTGFAKVKQLRKIGELRKTKDELAQLRRAYQNFYGEE